jgi:hypothetical protein
MKVYRALPAVLLVACVFVACKKAEYTEPSWEVGDWASYEVTGGTLAAYTLRYAITGVDTVKGEPYYWFEMIGSRGERKFIYKMLVPYGYRGVAERMIIKVADQLIEMPQSEGLAEDPPVENRPYLYLAGEVNAGKIGEEKITVPAGKFLTIHAEVKDLNGRQTEVWVSGDVPVFGIVAQKTPVEEMKLVATGDGAVTAITEEPVKIDPFGEDGR